MHSRLLLALLIALLAFGCKDAESTRIEEVQARLQGTWLLEFESGGQKVRRMLALGKDGKFNDRLEVTSPGQGAERLEFAGEWSYDGMNLKRRFLSENGRQFSGGKIRFATFPLTTVSVKELILEDNIQGKKLTFQRTADGAAQ